MNYCVFTLAMFRIVIKVAFPNFLYDQAPNSPRTQTLILHTYICKTIADQQRL